MPYGVRIMLWGDLALFSPPEMKVDRVSYDMMTPLAAKGILDSVYYHPGMRWIVDKITVLNPIRFSSVRRSIPMPDPVRGDGQRTTLFLQEVRYVVEAHFEVVPQKMSPSDTPKKFFAIASRRLNTGQFFSQPYFGCRECPCHLQLLPPQEPLPRVPDELLGEKDLGWMLYDMDYSDPENVRPQFFRAVLHDGVLRLSDCVVVS